MSVPILRYSINGADYLAGEYTQGLEKITLSTALETDQLFYRTQWKGDIIFHGKDYKLFYEANQKRCCQTILVSLFRRGRRCVSETPYWNGKFNLSDLEFDVQRCEAKLTEAPRPDDGYQTLLENWTKEVNWLSISNEFNLTSIYSWDRKILYRRGRLLTELLAGMVRFTLTGTDANSLIPISGIDTVSVFLESKINPVTRKTNHLKDLVCLQASDVMAPGTPQEPASPATRAILTLRELVDDMQALFCLYPYIEPTTGKLRWEHESFFPYLTYDPPTAGYSLPDSSPYWNGKKVFKADTSDLYGQYVLSIEPNKYVSPTPSNDTSAYVVPVILNNPFGLPDVAVTTADDPTVPLDFSIGTITFDDPCISRLTGNEPSKRERTVNRFCTYIDAARKNPEAVDKARWIFLVETVVPNDTAIKIPQITFGVTDTFGVNVENGNLSASSLVRDFHRHNKPFSEGYTNISAKFLPDGIRKGMLSLSPNRKLVAVTVPYCCDDTPVPLSKTVETWYGSDGLLVEADYNLANEALTMTFVHAGPCQIAPSPPFDANGNPLSCPEKGTYLRMQQTPEYPENSTLPFPCRITVTFYYADGNCGEYGVTNVTSNGLCD